MKAKDLILIALLCANVTLAAVALSLYVSKSESAAVAACTTRAGDYVIASGPISTGKEAMLVIDVVAKQANLYCTKAAAGAPVGGAWELTDQRSLAADFKQ
jgi:recombinational DNA repair protein RecR